MAGGALYKIGRELSGFFFRRNPVREHGVLRVAEEGENGPGRSDRRSHGLRDTDS
jgi:hypothetical protein